MTSPAGSPRPVQIPDPRPPLPCEMFPSLLSCRLSTSSPPAPRLRQQQKPQFWAPARACPLSDPLPTVPSFWNSLSVSGGACAALLRPRVHARVHVCVCACLPCGRRWGARRALPKVRGAPSLHCESTPLKSVTARMRVTSCGGGRGWWELGEVGAEA